MDNDRFARTIKNARLKKGYTQSQLADLLNVSNKTISKWETGRGYPDITLLAKITSVLKLDIYSVICSFTLFSKSTKYSPVPINQS